MNQQVKAVWNSRLECYEIPEIPQVQIWPVDRDRIFRITMPEHAFDEQIVVFDELSDVISQLYYEEQDRGAEI